MLTIDYSANKYIFDKIKEHLAPVPFVHASPHMPAVVPGVTYFIEKNEPAVFADDKTYLFSTEIILDIWTGSRAETERLSEALCELMESEGYTVTSGKGASSDKTLKCRIIN